MAREYKLNYRERITEWVWERMQAHFGPAWATVYGPVWDAKREKERKRKPHLWPRMERVARYWADGLANVPEDAIARAVEAVAGSGRIEPPTWPEFLALCSGEAGHLPSRKAAPVPETEEQRAARMQRGLSRLSAIKMMVGG